MKRILIFMALAVLAMASMSAASITFSGITAGATSFDYPNPTVTLLVPQFDTTLGTLTGIQFTLGGTAVLDVLVENTDNQPHTYNIQGTATIGMDLAGTILDVVLPTYTDTVPLAGNTSTVPHLTPTVSDTATSVYSVSGTTASKTSGPASAAGTFDVSPFLGAGTLNLNATGHLFGGASGGPGGSTWNGTGAETLSITYLYDTGGVPEPGTLLLLGAGLIGLGAIRRKLA